jgi:hypothetical protein
VTTDDFRSAPSPDGLETPHTRAPQAQHDERYPGRPQAGESTGTDPVLGAQSEPNYAHEAIPVGAHDEVVAKDALITVEASADYRARWQVVQGDFIDEPRKAVTDADGMVGEILDQLASTFREQRQLLEQAWADDKSTTEDLRIALRRYRTFFDRLLTL